ncbi:MAG: PorT family protein [Prevotellaceae bacterium]|jgi:hypothetical protein|nr:PorT family protein [Prevotellaceae bacterium]
MNMINKICLLVLAACQPVLFPTTCAAGNDADSTDAYRGIIGVSLGTDIGGAIPYPVSNIPGTINAYPLINVNPGIRFTFLPSKRWSPTAEAIYKTAGMKVDARVTNQRFNLDDATMYFSGTTTTEMKFSMIEIPVYVRYRLGGGHGIFAGAYYAAVFSSKFIAAPVKGYVGSSPDMAEITDVSNISMDFTPYTDNWDCGLLAGYEYRIFARMKIAARFSMGFKDIFKPQHRYFDYRMLHARGSVTLSCDLIRIRQL